jgi:hypothetical protein
MCNLYSITHQRSCDHSVLPRSQFPRSLRFSPALTLFNTHLPHTPHAQIARRANPPHTSTLASSGKSKPCSRASRLDEEGRFGRSSRHVRRGCGGRGGHVGRTWLMRTAKSCGSGAPMQALNSQSAQAPWGRRWQPSMVIGKSTKETVKTIAQGMPVDPA